MISSTLRRLRATSVVKSTSLRQSLASDKAAKPAEAQQTAKNAPCEESGREEAL
jgi:hypothetical protein